ncbi:MAG: response regulator [Proteobacteria bacterium]|nr:response regulator [Pseudomonadota bacterium]
MSDSRKIKKNSVAKIPSLLTRFLWKNNREIIVLLSESMKIISINPAAESYFFVENYTLRGQPITSLLSTKQIDQLQQALLHPRMVRLKFKSKKPLMCSIQPLREKRQQKPKYIIQGNIVGTMEELRSRATLAEQQYAATYRLLQNIIDSAPGLIYWKDREGRYLGVNKFWCDTLGVTLEESIGKKDESFWPEQAKQLRKNDQKAMTTGATIVCEESTIFNKTLGEVIFMTFKSPLRDADNNVTGIIGTSLDITELKKVQRELVLAKEKAEAANRMKSNFVATISHEIRTPMNAILGMAQILQKENLSDRQHECVDAIRISGKNLLELINDILDYSKLEAQKLEIKPEPFDLVKLIHEACDTMQYRVAEKHIALITEYKGKMPKQVIGDQMRIRQILLNLLSNAVKFTERGHIKISVEAKPRKDYILFKISVADTGIGIAKKNLSLIFEHFMQVDSPYSRRFQGTGLGLAIVKSLVEAMHGKIGVESELRKGSRFWFNLPLRPYESVIHAVVEKPVEEEPVLFTRNYSPHILVVEDNMLNQKVIKFMLNELGCQITFAENGETAIELFKKNHYHLIFMDIGLPGMNGLEVIGTIRKLENKHRSRTPIVALSAHVGEDDFKQSTQAGADYVLTKPVIREELIKVLNQFCANNLLS